MVSLNIDYCFCVLYFSVQYLNSVLYITQTRISTKISSKKLWLIICFNKVQKDKKIAKSEAEKENLIN